MTARHDYARGLRELADFIEAHPELPLPQPTVSIYPEGEDKATAAKYARSMAPCEKDYNGSLFTLRRSFGPVRLEALFWREAVCRRVVTGTREVPEHVTPASTEEIVEWVCDEPILKGSAYDGMALLADEPIASRKAPDEVEAHELKAVE